MPKNVYKSFLKVIFIIFLRLKGIIIQSKNNRIMKNIKEIIKPVAILTIALLITTVVVGMIAYANCEEAKLFIDNMLGTPIETSTLGQA